MGTERPTYGQWQETRRWMVVEAEGKSPAKDWVHPHPNIRRERRVNQGSYKVASNTPKTWLTYAEAMTVIAAKPGRRLCPAYVYSGQHEEDNENPIINFLDLDAHPENTPEGHDAEEWRDAVVELFLDAVPELRPGISVSGIGRHMVFAMDPADRQQWEEVGKLTEIPTWSIRPDGGDLGAAKIEMWNAWAGGRYQVFTGKYAGVEPDLDDLIPLMPFRTFTALLERLPDRPTTPTGENGATGQQRYPPGPEYATSELGQAYRLALSEAAAEHHMMVTAEGRVYILDDYGVGHDLSKTRGRSIAGARLFEVNSDICSRLAEMNPMAGEAFQRFVDGFRMQYVDGIIDRLLTFPESKALQGLVRHRDSDAGARITSSSLNLDYFGGRRQPWIIGADDIVRDIAAGKPLDFSAVVRRRITSDRTPLKVADVDGALDRDTPGARYVKAIAEAWGESLRLVAWLMLAPRKTAGVIIGPPNVGKSSIFGGLQAAGMAALFEEEVPPRLRAKGRRSQFDYLAKVLTEFLLAVIDDVPTVDTSEAVEISVTGVKSVLGSTTLGYEVKGEDRVNPRRRGSLLFTSNPPGPLLNTENSAMAGKLLFIDPPKQHPLLDSEREGMEPETLFTPDGQAALVDLLLQEMRRVIHWKGPRFDMGNLTEGQQRYHTKTHTSVGLLYRKHQEEEQAKSKKR